MRTSQDDSLALKRHCPCSQWVYLGTFSALRRTTARTFPALGFTRAFSHPAVLDRSRSDLEVNCIAVIAHAYSVHVHTWYEQTVLKDPCVSMTCSHSGVSSLVFVGRVVEINGLTCDTCVNVETHCAVFTRRSTFKLASLKVIAYATACNRSNKPPHLEIEPVDCS